MEPQGFCPATTCRRFVFSCSQQLETDLKIEKEWRQTLQSDLERERDAVAQLSAEALQINGLKKVRRDCPHNFKHSRL